MSGSWHSSCVWRPLHHCSCRGFTLDGTEDAHSGVTSIALLASPLRDYLFGASPIQALILTVGPAVIALLTIITGSRYCRRRSVYWAPPLILVMALGVVYLTEDLVDATHEGLDVVMAIAIFLTIHQLAIRIYVAARRRQPFATSTRVLERPWGERLKFVRVERRTYVHCDGRPA